MLGLGCQHAALTNDQLWLRYFALGGEAGPVEVEAFVNGLMPLAAMQRDLLAQAVNERLDELSWPLRVPFSHAVRESIPEEGLLAGLVGLLDHAFGMAPEGLGTAVAAAGRALGVQLSVYLVDYQEVQLLPLDGERTPLTVDTTLPGRAFRALDTVTAEGGGDARLWMPLLDGTERLGVLEVGVEDARDLHDPVLRAECRSVALLLGRLVTAIDGCSDAIDAVRRRRSRSVAAELVWQLAPPLTAATDAMVVSGMVEPGDEVGGDTFDYALSGRTVSLAIFDAVGHGLRAGLIAAAALAAYRSARRNGEDLSGQARAIDETVAAQFGSEVFLTGVLAELDVRTGVTRYLLAGHPSPLVLRKGRVVSRLEGGHRLPFGIEPGTDEVAGVTLQPDDRLVLFTDGVVEARDATGAFFGEPRLIDFLEREASAEQPAPETLRRLMHTVLAHQNGVLQDDATLLVAHWRGSGTGG